MFLHARTLGVIAAGSLVAFSSALFFQGDVAAKPEEAKPLKVGASVPDSTLVSLEGKAIKLSKVLDNKPTVLIFYRGSWCPFCNVHLADLAKIEKDVLDKGYQIIAITPDLPSDLKKTMDKQQIAYQLFSDSKAEAMKKFGVAFRLDDTTFAMYKDKYHIDLEKSSGEMHHILPVPSVFLINKSGKITFVHSDPNYRVRLKGSELLKAIDENKS